MEIQYKQHPGTGLMVGTDGSVILPAKGRRKAGPSLGYSDYNNYGYRVIMYNRKRYYVHRLVAETWIPNPDNLPHVDHINRCPSENFVENLRWADYTINRRNRADVEKVTAEGRKHVYENEKKKRWMDHYNHFVRDAEKQLESARKWRKKHREKIKNANG